LSRDNDKRDLLKNLKRVSSGYEMPDYDEDDKKTGPQDKVESIFRQLENLKKRALDPTFDERSDLDDEILKEVYDESVSNLLRSRRNLERIKKIFDEFNFELVMAQPRAILIVLLADHDTPQRFSEFLLKKKELSSRDIYLVLNFLCQTEFKSLDLVKLLRDNSQMQEIMETFGKRSIATQCPGYFSLEDNQILKLSKYQNIIEQIRLRVQCERRDEYSVSLNHLLNEVHAICYNLDVQASTIPEKEYDANKAVAFLVSKRVPHNTCLKIRNLFDRRNKNPVSHPDQMAWSVSKDEYFDYYAHVDTCLKHLL
jgi:AbiA family abortive infection protein